MNTLIRRLAVAASLLALAGTAAAHPGHDTHGLLAGLAHPFGLDHLLAMVAVGAWSATALTGARRGLGPLAFLGAMALGALAGAAGLASQVVEPAIAASVVGLGVLLFAPQRLSPSIGLALVAATGALHGLAHGAAAPASGGVVLYAAGFLVTTAALHAGGLLIGARVGAARTGAWRAAGAMLGVAGLVMLAHA
jgi:urease accessory protein